MDVYLNFIAFDFDSDILFVDINGRQLKFIKPVVQNIDFCESRFEKASLKVVNQSSLRIAQDFVLDAHSQSCINGVRLDDLNHKQ